MTAILDDAGINYLSVDRARQERRVVRGEGRPATVDGAPLFADPLRDITDQIGVRVITYVHSDVDAVADLLADQVVVLDDRDMGQETAQRGPVRLRQPAPAGRRWTRPARASRRYEPLRGRAGAGADPHRAAARVGGVRARHPLQGHGPRRARARLRPPVHPGRRAARARRPGVLHDPRPAAQAGDDRARGRARATTTRGSARASSPRSWPASTPTPAGRAPTTTPGSPACCSSSGITSLTELADAAARRSTSATSTRGWTTATRPAPYAASTTRCCRRYGDALRRPARQRPPGAVAGGQAGEDARHRLIDGRAVSVRLSRTHADGGVRAEPSPRRVGGPGGTGCRTTQLPRSSVAGGMCPGPCPQVPAAGGRRCLRPVRQVPHHQHDQGGHQHAGQEHFVA